MRTRAPHFGLLGLLVASLAAPAHAFVLEADDAQSPDEQVAAAARWDANQRALVEGGGRGLGGGVEYAVDDSVCLLDVVDASDCEDVRAHIAEAARRWSFRSAVVSFTDVTGLIAAERAPERTPWRGHGAEIDIFAVSSEELREYHPDPVAADTRVYFAFAPRPRSTAGGLWRRAAGRITAADIRINADYCYRLDPEPGARACIHLGSVVMHEFAHALGLAHPDDAPERNIARAALQNASLSGCENPQGRYRFADGAPAHAVANGRWAGAVYWLQGLSADDIAGRDALYPDCR